MAPVGEDRARKFLASARAATIIHGQDRVSVRREELPLQTERMLVLPVRPSVNAQQQRDLRPLRVTDGVCQQAVDFRTILTLEADIFGGRDFQLGEERV